MLSNWAKLIPCGKVVASTIDTSALFDAVKSILSLHALHDQFKPVLREKNEDIELSSDWDNVITMISSSFE